MWRCWRAVMFFFTCCTHMTAFFRVLGVLCQADSSNNDRAAAAVVLLPRQLYVLASDSQHSLSIGHPDPSTLLINHALS